ncbi:winged helix DNA-binding domain-containing protein [soil metagenome]
MADLSWTAEQRRSRLMRRHGLNRNAGGVSETVRSVVAAHSSDPATPYLASWARMAAFKTSDLDSALVDQRSVWRLHAMRRTLFVVPSDQRHLFEAGASRDIAIKERRRLEGWLESVVPEPAAWLEAVAEKISGLLEGVEMRTQDLAGAIPEMSTKVKVGSGKWATETPVSSRLLFLLAMEGRLVRTRSSATWRSSQYHWTRADTWLAPADPVDPDVARRKLLRLYLYSYGPATLTDIRWWTGWTQRTTRPALEGGDIVAVAVDGNQAYTLAGDEPHEAEEEGGLVALLPGLDSTPMGWKQRDWYLGDHGGSLFDRNGNVGPTVWVDGRIVGGWAQEPGGQVVWEALEALPPGTTRAIDAEAGELSEWLDGTVVTPRFRTSLERRLSAT